MKWLKKSIIHLGCCVRSNPSVNQHNAKQCSTWILLILVHRQWKHLYYPSSKQCINVLCIDGYFFAFNRILQKKISIFEFLIHPFDHLYLHIRTLSPIWPWICSFLKLYNWFVAIFSRFICLIWVIFNRLVLISKGYGFAGCL